RFTEVDVNVDQSRRDKTSAGINRAIGLAEIFADLRDLAVAKEQISLPLQLLRGIEDRAVLDEECRHLCFVPRDFGLRPAVPRTSRPCLKRRKETTIEKIKKI